MSEECIGFCSKFFIEFFFLFFQDREPSEGERASVHPVFAYFLFSAFYQLYVPHTFLQCAYCAVSLKQLPKPSSHLATIKVFSLSMSLLVKSFLGKETVCAKFLRLEGTMCRACELLEDMRKGQGEEFAEARYYL